MIKIKTTRPGSCINIPTCSAYHVIFIEYICSIKKTKTVLSAIPSAHFLIAGARFSRKTESIQLEESLHALSQKKSLRGHVHFLGTRTDIPYLMKACDLLALPSRQDPFPRVLLEAMAARLPVVATHVGGIPELLVHEDSALLVPPDRPQDGGND